jgi:hypothetical protein
MKKLTKTRPEKIAGHYHSLGLLCRQQAVRHPEASWRWLSEAERYEHLAAQESQRDLAPLRPPSPEKMPGVDLAPRQQRNMTGPRVSADTVESAGRA